MTFATTRQRCCRIAALACLTLLAFAADAAAITIPTVPVGDAGNANNPADGDPFEPGAQNFGAVSYTYRIGTTEVTNAQYAAFLNAKAASDPLGLYNMNMASNLNGGIARDGSDGGYSYAERFNMGNKPVNFVSWYDSIRFANWLNNGQGTGDTETGAYTLLGGTPTPSNGDGITRNTGAAVFLPSENEWYKAAYYDPRTTAQGGPPADSHYWLYPTASNNVPTVATSIGVGDISNPGANVANYNQGANGGGQQGGAVTTVGSAGPLSASFYGTSDQAGNVWEWNEEPFFFGIDRGIRGGSYFFGNQELSSNPPARWGGLGASGEDANIGFRVASVPEPSSITLAAIGLIGLAAWGWRRCRYR